ncbi:MAG: alpha/beta hydrolase family protein [Halobacterium sp.]
MVPSDDPADVARAFADRFADEAFADAADLLAADGRDAVAESFPEGFPGGGGAPESVLREFWFGLYGQYGGLEGVGDVDVAGGEATVELRFEDGTQPLELAVADGAVTDFALPSEYEPPPYADPDSFAERDVTVDAGDVELAGKLAVPDADGPVPGVVLVHGAGLHDPDATAGNSKILKDFAWGLASEGIAVLRYEKRLHERDVDAEEYTLDNVVVEDAVAAVDELAAASEVDADSVFVAGHSQGGMAAPRIADYHGGVAGVVSLDGPTDVTPDPEDTRFVRYSLDPYGDLDEEQQEQLEAQREILERLAEGDYDPDEEIRGKPGRWHDSLQDCEPAERAAAIDAPVFVAKAGRADPDVQPEVVEMQGDMLAEWRAVDLGEGSRVEFYEDVGHYFQAGHEPSTMTHLHFADNVAEYVVADVADWVHDVAAT